MTKSRRLIGFAVIVFLVLSPARADETAGSITAIRGAARVYRNVKQLAATVGMLVLLGDKIETLAASELTLVLSGGTELKLSESSTMTIDQNVASQPAIRSTVGLIVGKLRALVNATAARSVDFKVHTPNAVAGVRGTDFEIAYIEGKPCPAQPTCLRYTTVGVYQGTVVVSNPTSPPGSAPVTVTAGYQTTIPCETPPTGPSPWGTEELRAPGYH
jgi:ferric-dicitrate binding protein FerR (iron transport regulator)